MKIMRTTKIANIIKSILIIALKDMKSLIREKTIFSIIFMLLFITSFATVLTIGILLLYNPEIINFKDNRDIKVAFVGNAPLLEKIVGGIKYSSIDDAMADFYDGKVDAVVWLPEENLKERNVIDVILPKDETTTVKTILYLKEKFIQYEKTLRRLNGIPPEISFSIYNLDFKRIHVPENFSSVYEFIYVVLIPLLVLTVAIISAGLFIDITSEEYERKTAYVLLSTPVNVVSILLGKIVVSLSILVFLTVFWILILIFNGISIKNLYLVFLLSLSLGIFFLSISMVVASIFPDRNRSQLLFSMISVALVTLSYISPKMPSGLITRVCINGYFSFYEVLGYITFATLTFISSYIFSKKSFENFLRKPC